MKWMLFAMTVLADDGSNLMYNLVPRNSVLFDSSMGAGQGDRAGQLLGCSPEAGGSAGAMAPVSFQPPGTSQYANACDPSSEQFRRCMSDQVTRFRNVVGNCRRTFGENAKECCVDKRCMDAVNSGCGEQGCRQEGMVDEVIKNINFDQLLGTLVESVKRGLQRVGQVGAGTGAGAGAGAGAGTGTGMCFGGCRSDGVLGMGGMGNVPPGVLVYPTDSARYGSIVGMLNESRGGNPNNSGQCADGYSGGQCGLGGDREMRSSGVYSDTQSCVPKMCATYDRAEQPRIGRRCRRFCENHRRLESPRVEEPSDLTTDSCDNERR